MNDSRESQDIESICIGKLPHVPSQPAVVPGPRFMLSHDQSMPVDLGHRETFLAIHVLCSIHHRHLIKECFFANQSATGGIPVQGSAGRPVVRGEERIGTTIPMPMSAGRPSTMYPFLPAEIPLNSMAVQQRLQLSELHFDKFPTPSTFSCWKIRFKTQVSSCSGFPSEAMLWIKEVEMVDSVDELRSWSSIRGISMPNFEVLDARIASALNKIIFNSQFKRRISLEEKEAQKEDRFLRGRQIAFMICDYLKVSGAHDTVLDCADLSGIRFGMG